MTIALCGVIAAILIMFAWREIVHDRERKDLYNRLMARDLSEYKTMATSGKPPPGRVRNTVLAGMRHSTNQMNGAAGD